MKKILLLLLLGCAMGASLVAMESNPNKRPHEQEEQGPNKQQKTNNSADNKTSQLQPAAIVETNDDQQTALTSQELEIIKLSQTIKYMLNDAEEMGQQDDCPQLYFPNLTKVDFNTIKILMTHIYYQKFDNLNIDLNQLSVNELLHIIALVNYLDVPVLFDYCIQVCAQKLTDPQNLNSFISNPAYLQHLAELPTEMSNALACQIIKNHPGIKNRLLTTSISQDSLHTLEDHTGWVKTIVFSNDDQLLITGADDKTVHIYDISDPDNLTPLSTITDINAATSIALSSNGTLLAIASDQNTSGLYDISDPRNPKCLKKLTDHTEFVHQVAISKNDQLLAIASNDEEVFMYDISDPQNITFLQRLNDHEDCVTSMTFSTNNQLLITGSEDGMICLYDISDKNKITLLNKFGDTADGHFMINSLAISHDTTLLAVTTLGKRDDESFTSAKSLGQTVYVYDISDPHNISCVQKFTDEKTFRSITFSTNNQLIAGGSIGGCVCVFDISNPKNIEPLQTLTGNGLICSAAFSHNDHFLAGSHNNKVCIYDLQPFNHIKRLIPKNILVEQALLLLAKLSNDQPLDLQRHPHLLDIFNQLDPELKKLLQ